MEQHSKSWGYRAFRCREQDCDWRGLLKIIEPQEIQVGLWRKRLGPLIFMSVLLATLGILFLLACCD